MPIIAIRKSTSARDAVGRMMVFAIGVIKNYFAGALIKFLEMADCV